MKLRIIEVILNFSNKSEFKTSIDIISMDRMIGCESLFNCC